MDTCVRRRFSAACVILLAAGSAFAHLALLAEPRPAAAAMLAQAEMQTAEDDDEMLQEMMALRIDRDSATYYADLMGLDDVQREIAMDLYREYAGQYRQAAVTMRDAVRTVEESMGGEGFDMEKVEALMADMMRVAMGFIDRAVALGEQYVEDLGSLAASDAQRQAHERVEATRVRELVFAMSSMNGTDGGLVDLIRIGRDLDPPVLPVADGTPAQTALMEYEREIGSVAGPLLGQILEAFRSMAKAMGEGGMEDMLESEFEQRIAEGTQRFEAINERYQRRIGAAMPADRQDEWQKACNQARWPMVYGTNDVDRAYEAATALDGLTEDQREALAAAMQQYEREAEPANQAYVKAIQEFNAVSNSMSGEWNEALWADYQEKEQVLSDVSLQRTMLDQRFIDRMMQILTVEQREAMPGLDGGGVDAEEVIRQMGGG